MNSPLLLLIDHGHF